MPLKLMPNMSLDQQIMGTRRAILKLRKSKTGPVWLIPTLSARLHRLVKEKKRRTRAVSKHGENSTD